MVSADDLRVIAKQGYEDALSTDPEQEAQAVSRFRSAFRQMSKVWAQLAFSQNFTAPTWKEPVRK
jgi:hypothetical protein